MENNVALKIIIALIIGFSVGYLVFNNKTNVTHEMNSTMDGMTAELEGKTGDDFDKAFIQEMIVHHEGAVEMAQMALQNAEHVEIKTMANAIISAQTSEITQMKTWLKDWYGVQDSKN